MRDLIHPFWYGPPLIQYGPILNSKTCCVASVYQTKHTVSAFGPYFWCAFEDGEVRVIGESLTTPDKIRNLQRKAVIYTEN
jgi:hypothetical protein